jgi:Fe-S-cluster-containing hydrogenase component 2
MKTGKTQGYVLAFRCVNCGKHEVFASYPTEGIEPENQIRGRIYQVSCNSCGWNGDACGLSAIRISHTMELKARAAVQGLGLWA